LCAPCLFKPNFHNEFPLRIASVSGCVCLPFALVHNFVCMLITLIIVRQSFVLALD